MLYKVFEVTVKGNADAADRAALYQQKRTMQFAAPGLKDFVTGEKLTEETVFTPPATTFSSRPRADLKIGQHTPVVITSSDTARSKRRPRRTARVWVYRPLPDEAAKTVTPISVKILDRPNGPQPETIFPASARACVHEIKVTALRR